MTPRKRAWLLALGLAGAAALVVAGRRARSRQPKEREVPLHSLWTEVNGLAIHASVSADPLPAALPVVLVHGLGVSGRYLAPIARRIGAEHPVYVPDLPGHGRSDKPVRTLDVPGLAEALRAWMDAVGLRRAAFLANSMGCQTVVELAVRDPQKVDRLILVGPTADRQARTAHQQIARFFWTGISELPSIIPIVIVDYLRAGPRRVWQEMRAMLRDRTEEKLPRIDVPAMVLRGEWDRIVPRRWGEEVARLLKADPLVVIPNAAHAAHYSDARELMQLIEPFLRRDRLT